MDVHKNAPLTPLGREHMVKMVLSGQTPQATAQAVGVCPRTTRKWVARFQEEGRVGLQDRSSRPKRLRQPTPSEVSSSASKACAASACPARRSPPRSASRRPR
jgi:transposase-like protein